MTLVKGVIRGFDHASVLVENTNRALEFYTGVLGLEQNHDRPELSYPGAWLDLGEGGQIHLIELPNPDPVHGRPAHGGKDRHTALTVSSLDEVIAQLDLAKLPYTLSSSGRRALFCRDYDGNTLELIEK
ncbi:MAG: VOC family protein [Gammaproteobacteria bacterium]|jgi:glyoxylase I family protein